MKHLDNNEMNYWKHWKRAMLISMALFIHAWCPNMLESYASEKMKDVT